MTMLCRQFVGTLSPIGHRLAVPRVLPVALQHPQQRLRAAPTSSASYSDVATVQRPASPASDRVYVDFHVYKTRAAMTMRLLPPTFSERHDGSRILEREGSMLLEFANANPGSNSQQQAGAISRTYNWGSKVLFALTAAELGSLVAEQGFQTDKGLVMFHDPAKLGKTGEPVKRLTLKTLPDGAISFGISAGSEMMSVPVSRGEFEVIKTVAQFAIPRLLGFAAQFAS